MLRLWHPTVERFMQEDAYRGDGLNLYVYCGNNLVIYYDPSGHQGIGECKLENQVNYDNQDNVDVNDIVNSGRVKK